MLLIVSPIHSNRVNSNERNLSEVLGRIGTVNYATTLSGKPEQRMRARGGGLLPPSLTSRISCLSPIFHAFPPSPLSSHLFTSEEEREMNELCWTQTIMFAPFLPSPRQQPKHLKRQRGTRPTRGLLLT